MTATPVGPFEHPAAWTADRLGTPDDFAIDLDAAQIAAFDAALQQAKTRAIGHSEVTPETFPLPGVAADIAAWRDELRTGCGLVLLRGLPVERYPADDLKLLALGVGCHFGRPVSQSSLGDLVGEVVNIGGKDRRERAYRNSRELNLHTDRCDHIGMLCVRPAASGGISGYASALTVHNVILAERPDLLPHLYSGYFHHRFGEQPSGEPVVTRERIPIFSVTDGVASVIYIRGYIDLAVDEGHVALSPAEREALDFMDSVCNRPEVRLDFRLEPGDFALTNNCHLLHTRTAFDDSGDAAQKRYLLRLWLREDGRPMAPGVRIHKGADGIPPRVGKGTFYQPVRS